VKPLTLVFMVVLLAGCMTARDPSVIPPGRGGIDPTTIAGIEQSNRNTDDAARAQSQAAIDQLNRDTEAAVRAAN
jgi:phytoene dehydrogenase-like protein